MESFWPGWVYVNVTLQKVIEVESRVDSTAFRVKIDTPRTLGVGSARASHLKVVFAARVVAGSNSRSRLLSNMAANIFVKVQIPRNLNFHMAAFIRSLGGSLFAISTQKRVR
jgi:hypothetical protein